MKLCCRCSQLKTFESFFKDKRAKDGLMSICKSCDKERRSDWCAENSVRLKEYARKHNEKNPNRKRGSRKSLEAAEKARARSREYMKTHRAQKVANDRAYDAAKLRAIPKWADFEAIKLLYEEAEFCSTFFGIDFHVDHIVPLRSKIVCGLHWEGNLRVLTGTENLRKSNRYWPNMP